MLLPHRHLYLMEKEVLMLKHPTQGIPHGLLSETVSWPLHTVPAVELTNAFNSTLILPNQGHNYLDWFISSTLCSVGVMSLLGRRATRVSYSNEFIYRVAAGPFEINMQMSLKTCSDILSQEHGPFYRECRVVLNT